MFFAAVLTATLLFVGSKGAPFPDFEIHTPEDCEGHLCFTKPANYGNLQNFFDDRIAEMNLTIEFDAIQDRNSDFDYSLNNEDDKSCRGIIKTKEPYVIQFNEARNYVVQTKKLTQRIQEKKCFASGARCFQDFEHQNMIAECKTRYVPVKLLVYIPEYSDFEWVSIEIASDCYCAISS